MAGSSQSSTQLGGVTATVENGVVIPTIREAKKEESVVAGSATNE